MARICFFARVADPTAMERVEFYAQDIAILKDLGHEVIVATRPSQLVRADLYFCWWWTWAFLPLTLARLLRRPAIVTGVFDEWMFNSRSWLKRWLLQFALREADANIFISELERLVVPARFRVRDPRYSPCVVDTDRYRPAPGAPKERFLLTVGWLQADNARRKGFVELINALPLVLARHPDVQWIHCGERGSGYAAIQSLVDALGLGRSVQFRGLVSSEEKVRLMQRCGAYVQPSRFEGFGLAVLEAMACGAPVVASRGGALPEVVGDSGLLLDDLLPETIAARICELLEHPTTASSLGDRARVRAVSLFSLPRRRADIERTIADVLSSRP